MQHELAEAWWARVQALPAHDHGRMAATNTMAVSLAQQGKHAEAEPLLQEMIAIAKRVLGGEHPNTLLIAGSEESVGVLVAQHPLPRRKQLPLERLGLGVLALGGQRI